MQVDPAVRPERELRSEPAWRFLLPLFFIAVFVATLYNGWLVYQANDPFAIGDWLINYQGGFVRRGFAGELIFRLYRATGVPPGLVSVAVGSLCYACYFGFSYLLLRRQPALSPFLFLLFSPFLFLFQIHEGSGGFRKEVLFLALLAYTVWSARACGTKRFEMAFLASLFVYPFIVLSHEALVVYLPYLLIVYASRPERRIRTTWIAAVLVGLSGLSLVSAMANNGSMAQAEAICASLGPYAPARCTLRGAIGWLFLEGGNTRLFVSMMARSISVFLVYGICIALAVLAYIPILNRIRTLLGNRPVSLLWMLSLLGTVPIFFVALDWGRFIYVHLAAVFLVSFLAADAPVSMPPAMLSGRWRRAVLVVALGAYAVLWHLPYWGAAESFTSSLTRPVYRWVKHLALPW